VSELLTLEAPAVDLVPAAALRDPEAAAAALRVVACPHPFSTNRVDIEMPAGTTVAEILAALGVAPGAHARVFIDDHLIPREWWARVRPRAGRTVTVRVIPTGGDGGSKNILAIVLTIVVLVVAIAAQQYWAVPLAAYTGLSVGVAGAVIFAGVSIVGSLAIMALIPPQAPRLGGLSGAAGASNDSPSLSITGTRNNALMYGPVPRPFGRHRMFPPLGALPFTEIAGDDQYLRMLFVLGYGPLEITELKIGETLLTEFEDVETEIRPGNPGDPPLDLYSDDVFEDQLSIALEGASRRPGPPSGRFPIPPEPGAKSVGKYRACVTFVSATGETDGSERSNAVTITDPLVNGKIRWENIETGPPGTTARKLYVTAANGNVFKLATTLANNSTTAFLDNVADVDLGANAPTGNTTGPWQTRSTQAGPDELSVDIVLPNGLVSFAPDGTRNDRSVAFEVEYSVQGSGTWVQATAPFTVRAAKTSAVRHSVRWTPAGGGAATVFDVRVKRTTPDQSSATIMDKSFWTALRTIKHTTPITLAGIATIALRIKASEQLNGVIDSFNCIVRSILPTWNGSAWVAVATSNPASVYREILQGKANARPVADARLDLPGLQAWSDACATAGREFNAVIDFETTVYSLLRDVAAVGRASFGMKDGKYSVVRDVEQTVPVQHFTPRNSFGFTSHKAFPDMVHGLKVRFVNPDAKWQQDERIVYDDGFTEANATKFEVLELFGVTNKDQAWKDGRYHIACARLRPELYELHTDVEFLVCQRGDLVRLSHDVMLVGIAWGRIKAVQVDGGGNATGVTVDEVLTMEAGKTYGVRIRREDGASVTRQVVLNVGEQTTIVFTATIPPASIPLVGDLLHFGELGLESIPALVKSIEPGPQLTATLRLVDAAPAVHTADTGAIPPWDSQITVPPELRRPGKPQVQGLVSNSVALAKLAGGSVGAEATVSYTFGSAIQLIDAKVEARFRKSGTTGPWEAPISVPIEDRVVVFAPLALDGKYDLRLRTISKVGIASAWVTITGVKIKMPPGVTYYTLTPVAGGFTATVDRHIKAVRPPRVTGLRLENGVSASGHETTYNGRAPEWIWNAVTIGGASGDAEDDFDQDAEIRDYVIEIWTQGVKRRWPIYRTTPGFRYKWKMNVEDHGLDNVQRTVTITVVARARSGRTSKVTAEHTATNPAPDMSAIVPVVTSEAGGLHIDFTAYTAGLAGETSVDTDLSKFDVLVGTTNPPTPVLTSVNDQQRTAFIPNPPIEPTLYVQIVPHDAFGPGTPSQVVTIGEPPRVIGYAHTGTATPYFEPVGQAVVLAAAIDTVNDEIDILVNWASLLNILWGETRLTGKLKTALTSKFPDYTAAACCFDGADTQVMLWDQLGAGDLEYARLSANGTIEQAPVAKFPSTGSHWSGALPMVAVAYDKVGADGFFVVFVSRSGDTDVVQLARLGLTGTVLLSPVTLFTTADNDFAAQPAVAMDSDGTLHILFAHRLPAAGTKFRVKYLKASRMGATLAGPTNIHSAGSASVGLWTPGIFVDARDRVYPLTLHERSAEEAILHIGRITKAGAIRLPQTRLMTLDDAGFKPYRSAIAHDGRDDSWVLVRTGVANAGTGTTKILVDTFARING
jgi:hypothetical protein